VVFEAVVGLTAGPLRTVGNARRSVCAGRRWDVQDDGRYPRAPSQAHGYDPCAPQLLGDIVPLRLVRTVLSPGVPFMLTGIVVVTWAATQPSRTRGVRLAKLASRTPP